jgi:hypothetical protein
MKITNFFKQWSTFRGALIMVATVAGIPAEAATVVVSVADHLPELILSIVGAVEFFRDEKGEKSYKVK